MSRNPLSRRAFLTTAAWCRYFGFANKADITLDAILSYTPVIPSWGYNGSARRYWDFLYGGKYRRIERQLHHYGSGLNAIPLLTEHRRHPEDLYQLRAGYGGLMGPLANIDRQGFASAAFHWFPDRMAYDLTRVTMAPISLDLPSILLRI